MGKTTELTKRKSHFPHDDQSQYHRLGACTNTRIKNISLQSVHPLNICRPLKFVLNDVQIYHIA